MPVRSAMKPRSVNTMCTPACQPRLTGTSQVQVRTMMDPNFSAPNPPQNVLVMSACYASYMASSSNVRYQVRLQP